MNQQNLLPPPAMTPDVTNKIIHSHLPRSQSPSVPQTRVSRPSFEERMSAQAYQNNKRVRPQEKQESGGPLSRRTASMETAANTTSERTIVPRRHSVPSAHKSLPLETAPQPTIFKRMAAFVSSLFESKPDIIEYSNAQIAQRTLIRIKAKWVLYTGLDETIGVLPRRVLHIMVEVKDRDGPVQTMDLVARPKRVKEIMKKAGAGYVTEELYKDKIIKAMQMLKEAEDHARTAAISGRT